MDYETREVMGGRTFDLVTTALRICLDAVDRCLVQQVESTSTVVGKEAMSKLQGIIKEELRPYATVADLGRIADAFRPIAIGEIIKQGG